MKPFELPEHGHTCLRRYDVITLQFIKDTQYEQARFHTIEITDKCVYQEFSVITDYIGVYHVPYLVRQT